MLFLVKPFSFELKYFYTNFNSHINPIQNGLDISRNISSSKAFFLKRKNFVYIWPSFNLRK